MRAKALRKHTKWSPNPRSRRGGKYALGFGEVTNAQLRREIDEAFAKLADRKPVYRRYLTGASWGRPSAHLTRVEKPPAERVKQAAREYLATEVHSKGHLAALCRKHRAGYSAVAMCVHRARKLEAVA